MQLTEPGAELDILEVLSDCHLSNRPGAPVGVADSIREVLLLTESGSVYYICGGEMLNMKNGEFSDQCTTILRGGYGGDGRLTIGKSFVLPDRTTSPVVAACYNFESTTMDDEPVDPDALKNPFPVCRSAMERARDAAAEA